MKRKKERKKERKRNWGRGNYREFKGKHARTLIITRIRQCENVSGMKKYQLPRRFWTGNWKKKHQSDIISG
jgi:hypothetical protein